MKKKRLFNRIGCAVLAFLMILSLGLSPVTSQVARAEEESSGSTIEFTQEEESSGPTIEPAQENSESSVTSSSLSIGSKQDNLSYVIGQTVDVNEYFTIYYNGAEPYCVYDKDNGSYHISTVYEGYKLFYELFDVRYVKVDGEKENPLTEIPDEIGTYKAYASFRGTSYSVCEKYEDFNIEENWIDFDAEDIKNVEDGVIEFEIVEGREIDFSKVSEREVELVYGNEDLADEDAFILFMFGDGFTAEQQDSFYEVAKENAEYIMNTSPWNEFSDVVKIYALGTISEDSGAIGEDAKTYAEAKADTRDTYFRSSFWSDGTQRLLAVDNYGKNKIIDLRNHYFPNNEVDYSVLIVNSTTYGGSGGEFCVASLNDLSLEMMLHELGHTVAGLADEYWTYPPAEKANMTATSDPENVRWSRFIGKNRIGVYEYDGGVGGWYRPSQTCKMRYLGEQYEFCEVCKEELRKAFCEKSDVTKIFFQTYADEFYESKPGTDGEGTDMRQYFIIRRGENTTTGDQLDGFTIVYKDSEGNLVDGIPSKAGTYTVDAYYDGDGTYEKCELKGVTYTIELDMISFSIASKVYDGKPAEIKDLTIDYNAYNNGYTKENCTVSYHFTGSIPYSSSESYSYDSDNAPTKPGYYEVEVSVRDKETDDIICRKTKSFDINFNCNPIVNNDDPNYPGASVEYNNKTIVITGEGFTAEEQGKFEELAQKYVDYIQNTEPFKETQLYFNFTTVEVESDQSGIGREEGDTYFKLYYDDEGKIVVNPESDADAAATYLGYNVVTPYYKAVIVIVNDDNVKEGATTGRTVYSGIDEKSMSYAAEELLSYFTGVVAESEEDIALQRQELLKYLDANYYYEDYAVIVSRAYDETFVENGSPIELDDYFHTYIGGQEVPSSELDYTVTYYDNEGNSLGYVAPSKAGTYRACAELIPPEDGYYLEKADETGVRKRLEGEWTYYDEESGYEYVYDADGNFVGWSLLYPATEVTVDGESHLLAPARGWTTFTIQPASISGGSGNTGDSGNASDSGSANSASNATSDSESAAKTGDTAPWALYLILLTGAVVVCGTVVVKRRRR